MDPAESRDNQRGKRQRKYSADEIRAYRKHFDSFDLNGDGQVSASELRKVYRCMGYSLSGEEIKAIIQASDLDENGKLSFDEFLVAMPVNASQISSEEHRAAEIRRKFMECDRDGNGFVDAGEAHDILRRELAFTPEQSIQMIHKYDNNGDGHLSYEEFVKFYKKIRSKASQIKEMFQMFDRDQSGSVSLEEAKIMLKQLGLPEKEVVGLLEIHDSNKDGELQYEEFVAFLLHS